MKSSLARPITHLLRLTFLGDDEIKEHFVAYMTQRIKWTFNLTSRLDNNKYKKEEEEEVIYLVLKELDRTGNEIQFGTSSPLRSDIIQKMVMNHIKDYVEDHTNCKVVNVYLLKSIGCGSFGSVGGMK